MVSLTLYTVGDWNNKGSATDFNTEDYYWTLGKCLEIEDVVKKHIAIMDKYDPKKNIALMVDEWGTWWDVEPGTHPRHLVPANTSRRFRSRSYPTCLPQIYGPSENDQHRTDCQCIAVHDPHERQGHVLTPTYHVFEMYKVHQDATFLPMDLICDKEK